MREIEFRAWLIDEKKMIDVKAIDWDENGDIFSINYPSGKAYSGYAKDNIELMQYTGLIDRIGNKIYEGDIVKIWGRGFTTKLGCVNAIVVFEEAQFAFYINERYYTIWKDSCEMYEVIGNIYENPELLGEQQ